MDIKLFEFIVKSGCDNSGSNICTYKNYSYNVGLGGGVGSSALEFCLRHLIVCIIFNSRMMLPHVWLICALVPSMYLPFFNFHAAKQQHISSGLSLNGFVACPHTYLTNYLNMSFGVLCCLICYRFAGTIVVF